MKTILLVGCGGFLGAVSRYLVALAMLGLVGPGFPYGTWIINLTGSVLLGLTAGITLAKGSIPMELVLMISIGFLGAYTTFSTLTVETLHYVREGAYGLAAINSMGQMVCGLIAAGAGFYLGARV